MESPHLIKVFAAFVAGVVVALGSALIYVRLSDMHPQPAAQQTAASPSSTPASKPAATDTETADQASSPAPAVSDDQPVAAPARKIAPKKRRARLENADPKSAPPSPAPAQVAQNTPPPMPIPANPPSPAVNEPSQAPAPDTSARPQDIPAPALPAPMPHVVTLQAGTNLIVRLGETLSTEHNYTGDTFRGTLESPIIMDGFIIAEKGSKVLGRIVNAQKPGRVEGVGELKLTLTEINTTDGQRVRIETGSVEKKGQTSTGQDAAKIAGGAALGAIIGAIAAGGKGAAIGAGVGGAAGTGTVLATRGKPAVLPTESRLTFQLAGPVTITEKLNN
jgi:hypothetical protein